MAPKRESGKLIAENRKARYSYEIEDTIEAGIVLTGSEVKSLRAGKANIAESYASDEDGELYLVDLSGSVHRLTSASSIFGNPFETADLSGWADSSP